MISDKRLTEVVCQNKAEEKRGDNRSAVTLH